MELYDVVPTEKQGLDQGSLSNRKEFTKQNSCAEEGTQLFKVLIQEKHPQANDGRNFLEFTALMATTTTLLHTLDLRITYHESYDTNSKGLTSQ